MSLNLDAIAAAEDITQSYRRYLQTLMSVREPRLNRALRDAIRNTPLLDKGPFLEATPPYLPGASCRYLISEGVLHAGFASLGSDHLPLDRPLYVHQERAIRKVAAGRNVVVATGTGSGKTESFLLPILNALVAEAARGTLGPGVRALLLYPMNALANDQMKRLRGLLKDYPDITFGRYTGETQQDPKKARDLFADLNIGEPMLDNEVLSREEMRARPPHILLTNYAMLEYLLLRPQDMTLFGSEGGSSWRFVAVDEAHVYDGTQGAEIAMLLRRLRDRVCPDRPLQCIATSATVGADADPRAVTEFASRLFGQPFEWVDSDEKRRDLVRAERVVPDESRTWGPLSLGELLQVAAADDPEDTIRSLASARGFDAVDAATALAHEESVVALRRLLGQGPVGVGEAARCVFGDEPGRREGLTSLVDLASRIRAQDGTTVLSARYHLFLRATEGAYTCLSEGGPHVHLARHDSCPDCSQQMFELGSCKRCGAVHLVGRIELVEGMRVFKAPKTLGRSTWLVLGDEVSVEDEDETTLEDDASSVEGDAALLCTSCGTLTSTGMRVCPAKGCGSPRMRSVRRLNQHGTDEIKGCLVCGARGESAVRRFETGADAASAVIGTSLYQRLPPSQELEDLSRPGEGRKLLMFSDSRQSAAYFAPYFQDSYGRLQRRRLIAQGLATARGGDPLGVEDLAFAVRDHAARARVFNARTTAQAQMREVTPWVMAEALAIDDRISLEGLGMLRLELDRDPSWSAPAPLLQLGLSEVEAWTLHSGAAEDPAAARCRHYA